MTIKLNMSFTRRGVFALLAAMHVKNSQADTIATRDFMSKAIDDIKNNPQQKADTKMKYISIPIVTPFVDWDYYYTGGVLLWEANPGQTFAPVIVPKGFVTDLASVPSVLWSIFPPTGRYAYAAIVHDYLYWFQPISREEADKILVAAMQDAKVPQTTIDAFYAALRLAGASAWDGNAKARAAGEKRILAKTPDDPLVSWSDWRKKPDVFKP